MTSLMRRSGLLCAALAMLLSFDPARGDDAPKLGVFATASLRNAIDEIAPAYREASGVRLIATYASSSALAKQIEQGAPADVFISADLDWMDYLAERKLIETGTRRPLLGNGLVLIAPSSSTIRLDIRPGFALAQALGEGRLSLGEVRAVPAGRYAKAALESLGVWASVEGKLAQAENVRAALAFVALGETPLGIVYRTDALAEPKVKIIAEFPAGSHPPIVYPAAVTASARAPDNARAFIAWLSTAGPSVIFERLGFSVVE